MPRAPHPTKAELDILHVLWSGGPLSVREVQQTLNESRDTGYTTVLKTLQIMAEKGLVTRDESERSHVYAAAVPETVVKRRLVADLVDEARVAVDVEQAGPVAGGQQPGGHREVLGRLEAVSDPSFVALIP
jgi:predicted transcriptional regulator